MLRSHDVFIKMQRCYNIIAIIQFLSLKYSYNKWNNVLAINCPLFQLLPTEGMIHYLQLLKYQTV